MLETERLLLRPWGMSEAATRRELWAERDPRVPPDRRIDAGGHPTVGELEAAIRADPFGLLAVVHRETGDVLGYCGLVGTSDTRGEAEIAFEFFRRFWGNGYATEAAQAVMDRARSSGFIRLQASVWEWNTASRQVLAKIGFVETAREQTVYGVNIVTTTSL